MSRKSLLSRLLPRPFKPRIAFVPVVRLSGTIGIGTPLKPPLTMIGLENVLQRAFSRRGIAAVALVVNSPGGSAVQSSLIATRIRALAEENKVEVFAFVEDVAASGGYWLALAADEIYANASSIIGSIGVVAAGFGFVGTLKKLGIERRVHTAGKDKVMLDPFQPEKRDDIERLRVLQAEVHRSFIAWVKSRRGKKLGRPDDELFNGAFWSGIRAHELGLIDGTGHMHDILRDRLKRKVEFMEMQRPASWLQRRLGGGLAVAGAAAASSLADELEVRALWARFGL